MEGRTGKVNGVWGEYGGYSDSAEPVRLCAVGTATRNGRDVEVGITFDEKEGTFEIVEGIWIRRKGLPSFDEAEGILRRAPYSGYERVSVDVALA